MDNPTDDAEEVGRLYNKKEEQAVYESYKGSNVPNVQGLDKLLLSVADRMEGNVDGLSRELLVQAAYRIMRLEEVAWQAGEMIVSVPRRSKGALSSTVSREDVKVLANLLRNAGYNVKLYS